MFLCVFLSKREVVVFEELLEQMVLKVNRYVHKSADPPEWVAHVVGSLRWSVKYLLT